MSGADLVAANNVSGRHVESDGVCSERVKCVCVWGLFGEEKSRGPFVVFIYPRLVSMKRSTEDPQ